MNVADAIIVDVIPGNTPICAFFVFSWHETVAASHL